MNRLIIFTDLDGTLLDHATYSFEKAQPALNRLKQNNIPLVICSSKTKAEIERYRMQLENNHPFISENGGGIFIPEGYFKNSLQYPPFDVAEENSYHIIRLGANYGDLRRLIEELRREGFGVRGFGDMTAKEVAELTGLGFFEAELAKERDFDEPFIFEGNEGERPALLNAIREKGFHVTQGRFYHLIGNSDKGKAASILIDLYTMNFGKILTVAVGDSPNDLPMLEAVDVPIVVQKTDGKYDPHVNLPNLTKANGIGPEGWNKAILRLLSTSRFSGQ
jgi:mannosyl-3-phosphoglycerate phosphatase family protein